jgi:hypothetical protein
MSKLSSAMSTAANLPWGWITTAAIGLVLLYKWLQSDTDATQKFVAGLETAIQGSQLTDLQATIAASSSATTKQLDSNLSDFAKATHTSYGSAAKDATKLNNEMSQTPALVNPVTGGFSALGNQVASTAHEAGNYANNVVVLTAAQQQFNAQGKLVESRLGSLAKEYGNQANAIGLLNQAGVTSAQITNSNAQAWNQALVQVEAENAAVKELSQNTGQYGALENALGNQLTNSVSQWQNVTQAQSALMTAVTSGETSFISFAQSLNTVGSDAASAGTAVTGLSKSSTWSQLKSAAQQVGVSIAGAGSQADAFSIIQKAAKNAQTSVGGLGATSLQMSSDFYTAVNNAQTLTNSLESQGISVKNLKTVVATEGAQLLTYAGNNQAAQAAIVSLINNALGPGTVNLQNLSKWTGQNSTSMNTFNGIVGTTQVNASNAATSINNLTGQLFDQQLLISSGAGPAAKAYAKDIEDLGTNANATKGARQQLINDLEQSGIKASTATSYVNNLTKGLNGLPKNVSTSISDTISGSGKVTAWSNFAGGTQQQAGSLLLKASGGEINGPGSRTADRIPIMASNGEFMMQASAVNHYGAGFMKAINDKRFAGGGQIGTPLSSGSVNSMDASITSLPSSTSNIIANFSQQAVQAFAKSAAQQSAAGAAGNVSGAGISGSLIHMLQQYGAKVGWSAPMIQAWEGVIQLESGGNFNAKNQGSGAYGLAQFINGAGEYAQYGGNLTPSGQVTAMGNYIHQRYSNPENALAHEHAYHWYNKGGMIGSGKNFAMGGTITEPVNGIGMNSGLPYRFGEGGRVENVAYNSSGNGNPDTITHSQGATIIAALSQLVQVMQQSPQQTAAAISQNRQYRVGVPR